MSKIKKHLIEKLVPARIRITHKVEYSVVWVCGFKDTDTVGECCPNTKQIRLKSGMPVKYTLSTFIHEVIHAIVFERGLVGVTETHVKGLERGVISILSLNNILKFK